MGLDISHDCWHGAYSRFNRFRYFLAEKIGINLDEYIGYSQAGTKELSSIEHEIKPLLDHSDCDGELSVEESKEVLIGLNKILSLLNPENNEDEEWKEKIIRFCEGLEDAISENEIVEFR